MRKKFISIVFIACILLFANYISFGVKASGRVASENRSLSKFHSVKLFTNGTVNITQGTEQMVIVKTDDNIFPNIKTEVQRGELTISISGIVTNVTSIEIDIVMDDINNLTVNSAGRIVVQNEVNTDNMNLVVNLTGNISLNINTKFLYSKITSTGTITLSGTAETHEIEISGSGLIDAANLKAKKVKAKISNSGKSKVYVEENLDVDFGLGGGDLEYTGNPIINSKFLGGGSIIYKE